MSLVMLLDGNSLTYRAFFALPADMATASGQVTNAIFGFTSMVTNLLKDHKPDQIAVAFDRPEPTFRHEAYKDYKAGREAAPDILRQQMGLVRQIVDAAGITQIEQIGVEADDIIATLASHARDRGDDVIIVTGDRDVYQLVEDPHIRVLYNKRGVSDYALYDEAGIVERTGVTPQQYPTYAALRGDPSDNLPGVPGVGEKTAAKLVNDYETLDGIFANLDKLTPKIRTGLTNAEEQVRQNYELSVLRRNVDLDESLMGALPFREIDPVALKSLFDFFEFRTLWDRFAKVHPQLKGLKAAAGAEAVVSQREQVQLERTDITSVDDWQAWSSVNLATNSPVAMAGSWVGAPGRSQMLGFGVAATLGQGVAWISQEIILNQLAPTLTEWATKVYISAHDAKSLMRSLASLDIELPNLAFDTAIAAYLIDPAETTYVFDEIARRYAGIEIGTSAASKQGQLNFDEAGPDSTDHVMQQVAALREVVPKMQAALDARELNTLFQTIEIPLVRVLARMEVLGIEVDTARLKALADQLATDVAALDKEIQDIAGHPFMVSSTKQLQVVLFEELKLTPQKKNKTGFSTDAQSLEKLVGEHPIIERLMRYRELEKLRSTYGTALLAEVAPDGRIHATFNQTVARTGRLSSDQPNLHNIPVRSDEGKRFRECFIPRKGCEFLVADYNQIELRVIAHLAEDPGLIQAFKDGTDIHNVTAARVFGVANDAVTSLQRSKSKMISYGLAYGMEAFGLAQRLGVGVGEADQILKAYFEAFPSVRAYMDQTVTEARQRGYTETLFGRRRQIPELLSDNFRVRQAGERQAMNSGIQGLAADIFKVALVHLDNALEKQGMTSRIALQVHDEVVLEVPAEERVEVEALTREKLMNAAELRVPLEVNVSWGSTWASAKG